MAFSRSEDRGVQPVSVSYSSSTPPRSPSTYLSPRAEHAVVDADGIERWLTSPGRRGSTDNLANNASNGENATPRLRLADVTLRRRRQKIQEQNQPSTPRSSQHEQRKETTEMVSPRSSLRHSKLMKEWQEKERRQLSHRNLAARNIRSSQKQDHFRQTAAMTIAAMEKGGRGSCNTKKFNITETASTNNRREDNEKRKYQNQMFSDGEYFLQKNSSIDFVSTSQMKPNTDTETPVIVTNEGIGGEKSSNLSDGSGGMHECLDVKIMKRGVASPAIAVIRHRRQQRLQRLELEKEQKGLEKEVIANTQEHMDDSSSVVQSSLPSQSSELPSNKSTNAVPKSPRTDSIKNKDDANHDDYNHTKAMSLDNNVITEENGNSDVKDGRVFPVSRTKKIHLLKRHDAGKSGNSLVREGGNYSTDSKQVTINSDENSVSTIVRLRMIRRQMADGTNKRTREHKHELDYAHEQRLVLISPLPHSHMPCDVELEENVSSQNHAGQQIYQKEESQTHSQTTTIPDDQDQCEQSNQHCDQNTEDNVPRIFKTEDDNTVNNINNTRRIKDALARARSHRRSTSKRDIDHSEIGIDIGKCGGENFGERVLKSCFQSSSITCSSVIATGASTISVGSVGSSCRSNSSHVSEDENAIEDDDEITTTTSVSWATGDGKEIDDDGVSQLANMTKLEAKLAGSSSKATSHRDTRKVFSNEEALSKCVNHGMITPILNRDDSLISLDGNDGAVLSLNERILNQMSVDSSFDDYSVEELVMVIGGKSNEKEHDDLQVLEHASQIKLHVYDLVADDTQLDLWGCHFPLGQVFNAFNSSLHSIGTGAYHVGLEINGIEYAYGANNTKGLTGIFTCMPKCSPGYQYRTTIDFGNRVVMKQLSKTKRGFKVVVDGQEIVREMATEYLGTDYDLLRKNCCTFAHDVCIRLGIGKDEIPSWFHNLAAAGAITQDAANYTLAPITQLFAGKDLDKFTDYLNETALNDKPEAIQDGLTEDKEDHDFIADTAYQY